VDQVDGLIVVGSLSPEEINQIQKITSFITFVDSSPLESTHDSVVIDFQKSMINVLDHLLSFNHRSIGFIGGKLLIRPEITVMDYREKAFRDYLSSINLFDEKFVFTGLFSTEEGYELMKLALKQPKLPTAFFIASDSMAIGALRALHENNIRVPQQVSIIGFNDISASSYLQPSLSTVKVYTEFMGETAVDLMIERLETKRKIPKKVVIPTELMIRESTAQQN